jgi:hypothetical protein
VSRLQAKTEIFGREGRRLFERFMKQVERLRQKQLEEMQGAERGLWKDPQTTEVNYGKAAPQRRLN